MAEEEPTSAGAAPSGAQPDLTRGSIGRNLWALSWPMMISSIVMMIGPTIDMIWIGKLGEAAIAGVGASATVVMLINALMMGLFTGLRALVARFVGAGDEKTANTVAQQAFVIGVVVSLFMAAVGLFLAEPILGLLGVEPEVIAEGATYMRITLVGIFTMSFVLIAQNIMNSSGDAKTPMRISIGIRVFHILLAPFLIFGWFIFPRLGVAGAALTDVIAQGLGGIVALWVVFSGRTRLRPTLRNFKFDTRIIWRIVRIGIPSSLSGIHFNIGNIVLMWFIADFGTLAVASHVLVSRLDSFVIMPGIGFGTAAGILVAQNLGANQTERAAKTAWLAVGWFTGIMLVLSLVLFFWARSAIRLFSTDVELVDLASNFLRIQLVSYMLNGLMVVMMSVMSTVGDTLIAFIIDVVTMWGIRVPLAILLPKVGNLGVYGIRWALVADTVSSAIVFIIYFKSGRWRRKKV